MSDFELVEQRIRALQYAWTFAGFEMQNRGQKESYKLEDQELGFFLYNIPIAMSEIYQMEHIYRRLWISKIPPTGLYRWLVRGAFGSMEEHINYPGKKEANYLLQTWDWCAYYSVRAQLHALSYAWRLLLDGLDH